MSALARAMERLIFGGGLRFDFLRWNLDHYFRSLRRRQWRWVEDHPHFYDQRLNAWELLVGRGSPWVLARAFYSGEAVRDGDHVLDIGCGDGFFASRFLAPRAAGVDAIDIDERAIKHAARYNANPKVKFALLDAVIDALPRREYDVIIWDGAIGHFSRSDADKMLERIAKHLAFSGRFCGSEALGRDGADHLQIFQNESEIGGLLNNYFPVVRTRIVAFTSPNGTQRTEVLWRCARDPAALEGLGWTGEN